MSGADKNGRAYAHLSSLKAGDRVEVDGDFTCIPAGSTLTVEVDPTGELFIPCTSGMHFLDGQLCGEDTLVGVYPA
ncbi:hypothetical protein C100_14880 [Sphingobium sp. C100]|uniref:hypothetical protein n=1 Tax=Sphingobium sp. C100 TaxID=1207055 RepID=UPI0003D5F170|nr:hypothetical protein [Sphingobium sp. C100]ETI62995.1 hypothetical protein C100_14880 [Sphingobium sp. C100]